MGLDDATLYGLCAQHRRHAVPEGSELSGVAMLVRIIRPLVGFLVFAALIVALPIFRAPTRAMGGTDLSLDPTFGGKGMALPDVPSMKEVRALHVLPDGYLLSAGPVSPLGGSHSDFAVLKL